MKKEKMDSTEKMDLSMLIENLKSKDDMYRKATNVLQIVFSILILVYTIIYLVFPDSDTSTYQRIGGACYIGGFILLTIYFRLKYLKFKSLTYADPVYLMLQKAEKRFRFWHGNPVISIFAINLFSLGSYFMYLEYFPERYSNIEVFVFIYTIMSIFVAIGFIFGYIKWKKELRPIWLSVKKLLEEFGK